MLLESYLARTPLRIGEFILERPVGRGGMGEVWRGRHEQSLMPVAVKLLEQPSKSSFYHQAFRREMRAVASLNHSNIVHVYDYGTIDAGSVNSAMARFGVGSPYLVMELVEGGSIGQHRA